MEAQVKTSWREWTRGAVSLTAALAIAVSGIPAQAAVPGEPSASSDVTAQPEPSPSATPDDTTTPAPSPGPSPSPSPSPEPTDSETVEPDPLVVEEARAVPSHEGKGPRVVGSGRLPADPSAPVAPPGFATDTLRVVSGSDYRDSVRAGTRPGDSLVISVGEPAPANLVELQTPPSAPFAGALRARGAGGPSASDARGRVGDTASIAQFPGARDGFVRGSAFAMKVTLGAPGQDSTWVNVAIDTSELDGVFGANYADRVQFVLLPDCALERPDDPDCLTALPLDTERHGNGVVSVSVPANARDLGSASRGMSVGGSRLLQSGDLAAALAQQRGLKFAAPGGGTIVAAVSGAQGQTGDFKATDLAPKGTWGVSEQSGAFTYSVPIEAPPAQFGPVPSLSLSYSSASTDGKTESSNGQTSILGEGWASPSDFIERHYISCLDDDYGTGLLDRCWESPYSGVPAEAAYTLSLNGASYDLIWDGDNRYRTDTEVGWRITRHTRADATFNGDNDGEYFLVQTPEGTRYYFGYGAIGSAGGSAATNTNSVATVPVFGDDKGEPRCDTAADDECVQGYRWMLDITLDSSNNGMVNYYTRETNHYAVKGKTSRIEPYTSAINPDYVEYGLVWSDDIADGPDVSKSLSQAKVDFVLIGRCAELTNYNSSLSDMDCEDADGAPDVWDYDSVNSFPDVPMDLLCKASGSDKCLSTHNSPTFFTTQRLDRIDTYVRDWEDDVPNSANRDGDWARVDSTKLISAFPATQDGSARSLWLDSIYTHAWGDNYVDPADDTLKANADDLNTFLIKFDPIQLNNRVDFIPGDSARRALDRLRIGRVRTEFGGHIEVEYAREGGSTDGVDAGLLCPQGGVIDKTGGAQIDEDDAEEWYEQDLFPDGWDLNTKLCFPSTSEADSPTYHKYLVNQVRLTDAVAPVPDSAGKDVYLTSYNNYKYVGDPLWVYGDDVLADRADFKSSWNVFRGFETVESWTGNGAGEHPVVINQYYRGESQRFLANATLSGVAELDLISSGDAAGTETVTVEDVPELTGMLAATVTVKRDGADPNTDEVVSASHPTYEFERVVSEFAVDDALTGIIGGDDSAADEYKTIFGVGDVDKDGAPDLMGWKSDGKIVVFYGDGAGGFVDPGSSFIDTVSTTAYINVIPVGDWDKDGNVDYAVQKTDLSLRLRNGKSDGTFETTNGTNIGDHGHAMQAYFWPGDWDKDGNEDYMIVETDDRLRFREGDGGGKAASPVDAANVSDETQNRFADFDGDGHTDVANHQLGTDVWRASSSGTSPWWTLFGTQYGPNQVTFDADFNGNGKAEAAMNHTSGWRVSWDTNSTWEYINDSGIALTDAWFYDVGVKNAGDPAGVTDMIYHSGSKFRVRWSGTGNWQDLNTATSPSGKYWADVDGDGVTDMVRQHPDGWLVWYSAQGSAVPLNPTDPEDGAWDDLLIGDFNGDGKEEMARRDADGTWKSNPDWGTTWETLIAEKGTDTTGSEAAANYDYDDFYYEVVDFNGNGTSDIVRYGDGGWKVLTDAKGDWTPIALGPWAQYTDYVGGADYNGDGYGDLFAIDKTGEVYFHNSDGANALPATREIVTHLAADEELIVPGDMNGDSINDLVVWNKAAGTVRVVGGLPHITGGDGKHYSQIVRTTGTWSMSQETAPYTPAEFAGNPAVTEGTERTWRQETTSHTAFDAQFLPIQEKSTTTQTVTGEAPATHTTCVQYDHVWGIRDDADAAVAWDSTEGWGGDDYITVPWRVEAYEDGCKGDTGAILTGLSETLYDGQQLTDITWLPAAGGVDAHWSLSGDAVTRGLPTTEISYPEIDPYLGAGTATGRTTAPKAAASYDARGRISYVIMPNDFAAAGDNFDGTTGEPTADNYTQWEYGPRVFEAGATGGNKLSSLTVSSHVKIGSTDYSYFNTQWSEPTRGLTVKSEDANGHYTHYRYDAFGLLTEGYAPSDQYDDEAQPWGTTPYVIPTVSFVYDVHSTGVGLRSAPVAVATVQNAGLNPTTNSWACIEDACLVNRTYTFLDGFGRVIEQHTVPTNGQGGRMVTATRYNADGQVEWTASPFWTTEDAQLKSGLANPLKSDLNRVSTPEYDWAGRVTSETSTYIPDLGTAGTHSDITSFTASFGDVTQSWTVSNKYTAGVTTPSRTRAPSRRLRTICRAG